MKKVLKNIRCMIHLLRMGKRILAPVAKREAVQKMRMWITWIRIQNKVSKRTTMLTRWRSRIMGLCLWRTEKIVGGSTCLVILGLT